MSGGNISDCFYYHHDYVAVAAFGSGVAGISLLLLLAVVFFLLIFKKLHFFSQRLIFYLALSSILVNIGILLHRVDYEPQSSEFYDHFCQFGGYFSATTVWMLRMSISSIVVYITLRVLFKKDSARYEVVYVLAIFVFPLTFTWIPFLFDAYGRSGVWCWVVVLHQDTCERHTPGVILHFLLWSGPHFAFLVLLFIIYFILLVHQCYKRHKVREQSGEESRRRRNSSSLVQHHDIPNLAIYPVLYFALNTLLSISTTYTLYGRGKTTLAAWYISAAALPLMGSLVTLCFCLDPDTRKRLNRRHIRAAVKDIFSRDNLVVSYDVTVPEGGSVPRSDSHDPTGNRYSPYMAESSKVIKSKHWKANLRA